MTAANRHRGEVLLELGPRTLLLRPTFDAICRMESAAACGVMALAQKICDGTVTMMHMISMIETCQVSAAGEQPMKSEEIGEALLACGVVTTLPALTQMLEYILGGTQAHAE